MKSPQTEYIEGNSHDGSIDFHITYNAQENEYIGDIFNAKIKNNDDAYIDTFIFKTLNEALADLKRYQLDLSQ